MTSNSLHSPGNITQAGRKARSYLVPGQTGKVLAPVSKAIYLLTEQDGLFWLAGNNVPMHDRCALISNSIPSVFPGAPFSIEGSRLIVDRTFTYEIDGVATWSPPNITSTLRQTELAAHSLAFVLQLDCSRASGFGMFMPLIQALWQDAPIPVVQCNDPILQFSQSKVLNMAKACQERDVDQILEYAEILVGLGSGLTPSGDDFLGGILFTIKTIQTYHPDWPGFRLTFPIENYRSQTNPISYSLLQDLASGSAVEALHQIINTIFTGKSISCTNSFVSQLTCIGHSTGWDMLTGLVTGLLVIHGSHCFTPSLRIEQTTRA